MKTNLTKSSFINLRRNVRTLLALSTLLCFGTVMQAQIPPPSTCGTMATPGTTLNPDLVPKFVNDMPVIKTAGLRIDLSQQKGTMKMMKVSMEETAQDLLGTLTDGTSYMTRVWGYNFPGIGTPTYPGATIVAMKDVKIRFKWENNLPGHFLPVDASLHMAHPEFTDPDPTDGAFTPLERVNLIKAWYAAGNVPTVAHLHGGHTESASDGLPEAWFTQSFAERGNYFVKPVYKYDNDQEAATLWYHDHALGITRLNVYAGLAGFYLLRDDNENAMIANNTLPGGDYEIEIVIQDRLFDTRPGLEGQLFWPAYEGEVPYGGFIDDEGAILPDDIFGVTPNKGPTALAEMFGNIILVNGKAWPRLEVEPRKYRFRLLNGSDSRFYILKLDNGADFMVIGTDDGLLESPVNVNELVFAPGERYDVVVDFSLESGNDITMLNLGPDEPYGGGVPDVDFAPACSDNTGQIMQFQVNLPKSGVPDADVNLMTSLRPDAIIPPATNAPARQVVLFEGMDEFGRLQPMLGTLADGSLTWSQAITENPDLGATEMWEVYNATGDAHPIHLHLVSFQILNRELFTAYSDPFAVPEIVDNVSVKPQPQHNGTFGDGGIFHLDPTTPLTGIITDPAPHERGWKDTFIVLPGQVGRVVATFDRPGRYVWHCHILSHEDHEMMRPFHVGPIPATNLRVASNEERSSENFPNPFRTSTQVRFELKRAQDIGFTVFDMQGKMVYQNLDHYTEGKHAIFWDGFDKDGKVLQTGVYLYQLRGAYFNESKRLVIER